MNAVTSFELNNASTVDFRSTEYGIFDSIGEFLVRNRLTAEPVSYDFAYRVLNDPHGPLAKAVNSLTDGGVRLTRKDIVALGGDVSNRAGVAEADGTLPLTPDRAFTEGLVAKTQMQVEGFHDLVTLIRTETRDFGRDLEATADAIRGIVGTVGADDVVRLTQAMIVRVTIAETQLEAATREASELREKLEEARDNARRDPLTGLPNRRAFEEAYKEMLAARISVAIAVCDVDRFKQVNDIFGHAVGDRVLQAIAGALTDECEGHLVARYGGEEFVVLFSDVDVATAEKTLNSARILVAGKKYRLRETDAPLGAVTFSAGLTACRPEEPVGEAFVRADGLLYQAKDAGRNCLKVG